MNKSQVWFDTPVESLSRRTIPAVSRLLQGVVQGRTVSTAGPQKRAVVSTRAEKDI